MEQDDEIEALLENTSVSSNENISDEDLDVLLNDDDQLDLSDREEDDNDLLKDPPDDPGGSHEVSVVIKDEREDEEAFDLDEECKKKPAKVIKLASTGRYDHIRPLRTPDRNKQAPTRPRPTTAGNNRHPSPWVKSAPRCFYQIEPSLKLETSPPPRGLVSSFPPSHSHSFSKPVFNKMPVIIGQKRKLRSEPRVFSSSQVNSSSLFSKRSVNFNTSRSSFGTRFGLQHLQAQSDKFNLTHLK